MKEKEKTLEQYFIEPLKPEEAHLLNETLEVPNWAPWLAASSETLSKRAETFPQGQLVMKNAVGVMVASLSLNQINWDGSPDTLPTWDQVAGDPTDYSQTYISKGNTLVLLSMNVHPEYQGQKLPSKMIDAATELGLSLGAAYLIGSFRPNGYGIAKKESGFDLDFWQYCQKTRPGTEKPLDPWLGSLWHKGMRMIKPDNRAMFVSVGLSEWMMYKKIFKPELWTSKDLLVWECEEVGTWYTDPDQRTAYYIESNVWGSLPLNK